MEYIRDAGEAEMILAFLQGEIQSERFGEKLKQIMAEVGIDEDIVLQANLHNPEENVIRKQLLARHRGYPDRDMFERFPERMKWRYVRFAAEDIEHINYIDYSYWNELSQHTSKPRKAAETIRAGIEIYGVANTPVWEGLEVLQRSQFPPVILITANDAEFLIIEGHSRMTVYGMNPALLEGTYGYVGCCSAEDMKRYDARERFR